VYCEKKGRSHLITVRIEGGLGNQMFQYAAAKAAAVRLGVDMSLDIGAYNAISDYSQYSRG
jgi:hypothetical protein